MRVLITGGCGFIGTNLIARWRQQTDIVVRVFDNESVGKKEYLDTPVDEFVHGDLRDRAALCGALAGVDAVVHLAADTRVVESIQNPIKNFEVNAAGTFYLLQAMREQRVGRIVNASTGGAIIGNVDGPVHEEMVPRPLSPYGASKLATEGYCSAFSASYGLSSLSLRFSNVYGPRSFHKGSVVAAFFKRILEDKPVIVYGDGTQVRDYVFAADICDGIINGVNSSITGVIQLGSGRSLSLNELLTAIAEIIRPKKIKIRHEPFRKGEVYATYCDVTKARKDLGFEPNTNLHDGLADTWGWFQRFGKAVA